MRSLLAVPSLLLLVACHELEPFAADQSADADVSKTDAAVLPPDAGGDLDAAAPDPDMAAPDPDMAAIDPDMAAIAPDMAADAVVAPDVAAPELDVGPPEPDMEPDAFFDPECEPELPAACETPVVWEGGANGPASVGFGFHGEPMSVETDGERWRVLGAVGLDFNRFWMATPWDGEEGGIDFRITAEYVLTNDPRPQPPSMGFSVSTGDDEGAVIVLNDGIWDYLNTQGGPASRMNAPGLAAGIHDLRLVLEPEPPEDCDADRMIYFYIDDELVGEWEFDSVSGSQAFSSPGVATVAFGQVGRAALRSEVLRFNELRVGCAWE